jgi:hypothetical protein
LATVYAIRNQLCWKNMVTNLRFVVLTLCSAFIIASRSQAQFEGSVVSKNTTTDEMGRPQEFVMTMWIKKDMVRIETKGGSNPGSTMLYRTDMRKIYMVNDEEKTYFEISQDEKAEQLYSAGGNVAKFTTKKTGKVKTIAGYQCEQYIIKRGNEVTDLWGTKKLSHLVNAISKALGQEQAGMVEGAVNELMKKGVYPLRSSTKVDGNLIEAQEVTSVETKTLDIALFTLPADYKKQKTVDMMQGIQDSKK